MDWPHNCVSDMIKGFDPASKTLWIFPESVGTEQKPYYFWDMTLAIVPSTDVNNDRSRGKQAKMYKQHNTKIKNKPVDRRRILYMCRSAA